MKIEDVIMLAAMGPPGGGRSAITNRIVRHFNVIAYTDLDQITIKQIFNSLVKHFFSKFENEITNQIEELIDSVLFIYDSVKRELLPTPKKSHYTFNLRDISKVFQGICSANEKDTK
jgi:dynein heavy chain